MNFKTAFAAARKAGKKEFTWNGKSYNTKLKEEVGGAERPKARPTNLTSPRPKARSDIKPSVSSDAPKQPKAAPKPAQIVRAKEEPKPAAKLAPAASSKPAAKPAPKGGISDQERANKGKPLPKTKGPSVGQVARAIDFQGSGYTDVMKGGPRTPPKKKVETPRKKGGWGDQ